jgi:hypothetical protein
VDKRIVGDNNMRLISHLNFIITTTGLLSSVNFSAKDFNARQFALFSAQCGNAAGLFFR